MKGNKKWKVKQEQAITSKIQVGKDEKRNRSFVKTFRERRRKLREKLFTSGQSNESKKALIVIVHAALF